MEYELQHRCKREKSKYEKLCEWKEITGEGGGETGGGLSLRSEGGEKQIAFTFTKLVNSLVLIERNTGNVK